MLGIRAVCGRALATSLLLGALAPAGRAATAEPRSGDPPAADAARDRGPSDEEVLRRFLARPDEPVRSYRAHRHLEITSGALGKKAWMDVRVELDAERGLRYAVTAAGGSEMLQERILHRVLRTEQEVYAAGTTARTALTAENYTFAPGGRSAEGLVSLAATARRREVGLLNGRFLVTPDTADLVEVSGTMAKGPSFWIPRVDLLKRYARIQGHRVNVRVESISHVRVLGESRFTMTSVYEQIDGEAIAPPALARSSP